MKLLKLRLVSYRVLHNIEIDFDLPSRRTPQILNSQQSYKLDFLVGVNGTGKSTLLHALADIYQWLDGRKPINLFGFEITYELMLEDAAVKIFISNFSLNENEEVTLQPDRINNFRLKVNEGVEQIVNQIDHRYLPQLVIAFTTGNEQGWELEADDSDGEDEKRAITNLLSIDINAQKDGKLEELFIRELPGKPAKISGGKENTTNLFLFIRSEFIPTAIFCGLIAERIAKLRKKRVRLDKVLEESKIKRLSGFSLKFRLLPGVDSNIVKFVAELAEKADKKLSIGSDVLLVFDLTNPPKKEINQSNSEFTFGGIEGYIEGIGGSLAFFQELLKLLATEDNELPVLREVNIFLQRVGENSPLHLLEWLSDGERSFLGRLCLFSLLGENEALILLDEPEVHFNDFWKRQIVDILDTALKDSKSHLLVTTHSSITLTDVPNQNILILERNGNYTDEVKIPEIRTLAADPSDIIVNIFNASQASGSRGIELVKTKLEEAKNSDNPIEKLESLRQEVGPGYWSYLIRREIIAAKSREANNPRRTSGEGNAS